MSTPNLNKVPKFLRRLFKETSDPSNEDIAWTEDGNTIRIVNKDAFVKNTLPTLSKTKEYSAFIRQLNIYGFVKVKNEKNDDTEEYYNCFFKRDQPNLMGFMKRTGKASRSESRLNWPSIENSIAFLSNSNFRLSNEVGLLRERVDKQERTINGLLEILSRVFRSGIQNMKMDPSYSQQTVDKFLKYALATPASPGAGIEPVSGPGGGKTSPKKLGGDRSADSNAVLPDINDIFF